METSTIVFAGIVLGVIFSLSLVLGGVHKIMKLFYKHEEKEEQKKQEQKVEEAKDDLKQILNEGSISDLFDAVEKLGNENKKKRD